MKQSNKSTARTLVDSHTDGGGLIDHDAIVDAIETTAGVDTSATWTALADTQELRQEATVFLDGSAIVWCDAGVWDVLDRETCTSDDGAHDGGDILHPADELREAGVVGSHSPLANLNLDED